jgi:hypothetical protein
VLRVEPEQIWIVVDAAIAQASGKYARAGNMVLANTVEIKGFQNFLAAAPELSFGVQICDETA